LGAGAGGLDAGAAIGGGGTTVSLTSPINSSGGDTFAAGSGSSWVDGLTSAAGGRKSLAVSPVTGTGGSLVTGEGGVTAKATAFTGVPGTSSSTPQRGQRKRVPARWSGTIMACPAEHWARMGIEC